MIMSRKNSLFLLFFSVLVCLCLLFLQKKTYHTCLNLDFSSANLPITSVEIEEKKYYLEIDIGSKYALTLHGTSLSEIKNKKNLNKLSWKDFKGNSYSAYSYRLPKVTLKDIVVKDVIACTSNVNYENNTSLFGNPNTGINDAQRIGRPFLSTFKLLLDFKNSRMFISNDIKKLKALGFDVSNFKKIPMKIGKTGAIIQIKTDFGIKKLSIDTGSTITSLRKNDQLKFTKSNHDVPILTSKKFVIEGKDFGNQDFYLLAITPELNEVDGFLGMDFLKNHVVYIDFPGKMVYIE